MPSPFPGMDPWVEDPAVYPELHEQLAAAMSRELTSRLRPRYVARVASRLVTDVLDPREVRIVLPDVAVVGTRGKRAPRAESRRPGGLLLADVTPPVEIELPVAVPVRQMSVLVRLAGRGDLVTAIEIVSLANKRPGSPDAEAYQRKREEYLASKIHFMEIDLLRKYPRWSPSGTPSSAYRVLLSHAAMRPRASVWPIGLRDPLPTVPVPLRSPDPAVPLDLQALFTSVYDSAALDLDVDYGKAPPPPRLAPADVRWTRNILRRRR